MCLEQASKVVNLPVIQVSNLSYYYGQTKAVDNLTFTVPGGSIFGFLGPNGAGKTTTTHLLLGLLKPASGRIIVSGFDTQTQADQVRACAGALLEHTGLYERLSAEENLEFYGRIYRMDAARRRKRIKELLSQFDLWPRRKEIVRVWSRGMKQKLAIARALLHQPRLVFLDEPTAGMDPLAAADFRRQLVTLSRRENITIFLTTHNLREAQDICDLVGILRAGHLVAAGTPDDLLRQKTRQIEIIGQNFNKKALTTLEEMPGILSVRARNNRLKITLNESGDIVSLVNQLASNGVQIHELLNTENNLEKVFLQLMEE